MGVSDAIAAARDAMTVRRVYGEPYERDGLTLIPAAVVSAGAGAGTGRDEKGQEGEGGGFGVVGRPAGAYVVKDGEVRWMPAVDVNRLMVLLAAVAVVLLLRRPRGQRRARRRSS